MKRLERAGTFGSEQQKVRNRNGTTTVVLESVAVEVSPPEANGRPPKPSEDAEECPGWEKGRHRSWHWFQCQGWTLNGYELCKHCASFQREAPIYRSVSLETITSVIFGGRKMLEGVVEPFKDSKYFKKAWDELESIATALRGEHQKGARDYFSFMRRLQNLVPRVFAEEARGLLSKCESLASKNGNGDGGVHDAFHEWEAKVKEETERAKIDGIYPKWIFAGLLRHLYRALYRTDTLNHLAESIQQGPRRNNGGWDFNNSWRPSRFSSTPPTRFGTDRRLSR